MELAKEIPKDSNEYFDYKCPKCGRRIRFTGAFFTSGFTFPLQLKCKDCNDIFTVDLKITPCQRKIES